VDVVELVPRRWPEGIDQLDYGRVVALAVVAVGNDLVVMVAM
jgi:hypothetical protein